MKSSSRNLYIAEVPHTSIEEPLVFSLITTLIFTDKWYHFIIVKYTFIYWSRLSDSNCSFQKNKMILNKRKCYYICAGQDVSENEAT